MNSKSKRASHSKAHGAPAIALVEYLSVAEAGALTSTSVWFWRRQAYQGVVSSVKLGKRLLIPRAEVERMVAENTRPRVVQEAAEAVDGL